MSNSSSSSKCWDLDIWQHFKTCALERVKHGDFDKIFFLQICPDNAQNFDGTIRSTLFRGYLRPITVPITPIMRLSADEVENVRRFADVNSLKNKSNVILFECMPGSNQSFLTLELALEIAQKVVSARNDTVIVISSHIPSRPPDSRIIDGSVLSFRENAELTKYCSLLVGCSSGISWLATSDWAKPLPMVQILKKDAPWAASFILDHERFGLPTDNIIEIYDPSMDKTAECITSVLTRGFAATKFEFHGTMPMRSGTYNMLMLTFIEQHKFGKAIYLLANNIMAYGMACIRLLAGLLIKFTRRRTKALIK